MSEFYRKFLSEDVRKMGAPSGRQIFLAAFGKHPGWDDHVEDLGLESESLVVAKTLLYVQGIGGQIDSGAWEKLEAAQQLPAFKHAFLWQRGGQLIIGRMWSSSDGKGRKRYPMIVCAHCVGMPIEAALDQVLPRLEQIEQRCLSTNFASDVRAALDRHRSELRAAIASFDTATVPALTSAVLGEFVNHSALGPDKEGWFRILYQMQSQMASFAIGRFSIKGDLTGLRPQQVRLPACAHSAGQALLLWSKFFQSQLDPAVPLLYAFPFDEGWIDVTAGEPTPQEIFSLRASPKSMPLVSEVPYNLEPAFREKARAQVAAFAGETAMKARPTAATPGGAGSVEPTTRSAGSRPKLLRWLGGGAALLAIAIAAFAVISNRQKDSTKRVAALPSTPSAPADEARLAAERKKAAEEQSRVRQQELAAKAEAERRAKAEVQAKADSEARAKADAIAKAKADDDARQLAIAAEAKKRREADEQAKARAEAESRAKTEADARAKAEAEARTKADAEARARVEQKTVAPAPAASAAVPEGRAPLSPSNHMTNRLGLELIKLSDDLWVGKYEVTQGEYVKLAEKNPSENKGNPRLPVDSVTWEEAKHFCKKLTESEQAAGAIPTGFIYTLPTQAQWETFVADSRFDQAVTSQQSAHTSPEPVGSQPANKHGLYDVLGNVWEWCLDGPSSQERALRGGAFNNLKTFRFKPLTVATVHKMPPDGKSPDVGFRCVMAKNP
ncbi:MAG TPA: SUMF1/EgtB/PvdO family nonheme iron enzyme [Candidatus Binatia bacterium]|nr:SUMF1/EgtB/PvdO family nonheme iron enzyme [Candidatus Binatia bacterium]